MAERVEILVVATDGASQILRGVTSQFGALGSSIQAITGGRALEELATQVVKFGKDAVESTVKYAGEVRNLSLISGESTESTSRFLMVLDDYKLSADDAMAATRTLTKQGLAPNIDTLAKLSDEYLKLNSAEDKNAFIIKNLGRSGLQWVDILNKGSTALKAQGAAIDDSLILSQKAVDEARKYEIAMDNWGDAVMGVKLALGKELVPALTDVVNGMNAATRAAEIMREQGLNPANVSTKEYAAAMVQAKAEQEAATNAMIQNADAVEKNTQSVKENEEALKAQEEAAKAVSESNTQFISVLDQVGAASATFQEGLATAKQGLADGKLSADEYKSAVSSLSAEYRTASNEIVLSIVAMKLATDGWTTAELAAYLKIGKGLGLITSQQEAAAKKAIETADQLVSGADETGEAIYHVGERSVDASGKMDTLYAAQAQLADGIRSNALPMVSAVARGLNSIPATVNSHVTVTTEYITIGGKSGAAGGPGAGSPKAAGGPVYAGELYQVNEMGTEYFRPAQNGTVIPLGQGGNNNNSMGNMGNFNFYYSPMVSLGDVSEFQSRMLPAIIEGVRKAKADGII